MQRKPLYHETKYSMGRARESRKRVLKRALGPRVGGPERGGGRRQKAPGAVPLYGRNPAMAIEHCPSSARRPRICSCGENETFYLAGKSVIGPATRKVTIMGRVI